MNYHNLDHMSCLMFSFLPNTVPHVLSHVVPHGLPHAVCYLKLIYSHARIHKGNLNFIHQLPIVTIQSGVCATMDAPVRSDRPTKRRRTKNRVIREGDEATAEGFLITNAVRDTDHGPMEEVTRHPIWKNTTQHEDTMPDIPSAWNPDEQEYNSVPDAGEYNNLADNQHGRAQKTQHYYLQEFVGRIHPLLKALLSHEAPPSRQAQATCSRCAEGQYARWRCKDCTSSRIMCRRCMRETHMDNPFHRIEVWAERYFHSAELWEAGVYILVRHHSGHPVCPVLDVHQRLLDTFQKQYDEQEQERLKSAERLDRIGNTWNRVPTVDDMLETGILGEMEETVDQSYSREREDDIRVARQLDHLYRIQADGTRSDMTNADDMMEEDEVDEDYGNDMLDDGPAYMPLGGEFQEPSEWPGRQPNDLLNPPSDELPNELPTAMPTDSATADPPVHPRADSLNNTYVRVVHVNGVHHLALVVCSCQGLENTHGDLMAGRLVPTSFTRYRTVFTHAVLDDFRIANLECKASAYQYFQKLRRQTAPMAPDSVPNLYPELRRMSRLWRWMKKLKWAGFAHRDELTTEATAGELANFCPACPQPGINLPDDWPDDDKRQAADRVLRFVLTQAYTDGFISDSSWQMETSRQIMFGRNIQKQMFGFRKGVE